jgi:hypothetical protein
LVTPFLLGFSRAVVARLRADGDLALREGATEEEVATFLAAGLADLPTHAQLISGVAKALVACPAVEEVFADDDRLKELIGDLPRDALPR